MVGYCYIYIMITSSPTTEITSKGILNKEEDEESELGPKLAVVAGEGIGMEGVCPRIENVGIVNESASTGSDPIV